MARENPRWGYGKIESELLKLGHDVGNELLSRSQLVEAAPAFVAALVWLTRILFIGAFSVAGGFLFGAVGQERAERRASAAGRQVPLGKPLRAAESPARSYDVPAVTEELPAFLHDASLEDHETLEQVGEDIDGDAFDFEVTSPQPAAPTLRRSVPAMASPARSRK